MKKALPFLLATMIATPQAPQKPAVIEPIDEQTRIILDVTRVNILFTVSDRRGRFVNNLAKDEFEILEGRNRQNILEFTSESDLPLRVAILVDTSNSVRTRFQFIKEAAIEFVNSVVRRGTDKAALISFDTAVQLAADLTDDTEKLAKNIRDLRAGGGTALYDAIYFACRDSLSKDQPKHKFRRALIMLGDGDDNNSRHTRDQALEMAHKADAVLYAISTNHTKEDRDGDKVLRYFADETGGQAFFPFKVEDLSQSFENIANELRQQYNVLYRPEPLRTDGLYHEVTIRVKNRKDLFVRARHGYFAPKM
ncbi:MAG: VWA domain-containing protein [Bryobacteraceae bacterium]